MDLLRRLASYGLVGLAFTLTACGSDDTNNPEPTSARDLEVAIAASTIADYCVTAFEDGPTSEGLRGMYAAVDEMRAAVEAEPENAEITEKVERSAATLERCREPESAEDLRRSLP